MQDGEPLSSERNNKMKGMICYKRADRKYLAVCRKPVIYEPVIKAWCIRRISAVSNSVKLN